MNEHELRSAVELIDGYRIPKPSDSKQMAFENAKIEAAERLKQQLERVRSVTFRQFEAMKQHGHAVAPEG